MTYWLFKSEPDVFSIDDLSRCAQQTTAWEGVRNYQARNFLRDAIKLHDFAFFYHSSCKEPGIVGLIQVVREGYVDDTAFDKKSAYFDDKSTPINPRWFRVDVQLVNKYAKILSLNTIKSHPVLRQLAVAQRGNRLSITPVDNAAAKIIMAYFR